MAFRDRRLRDRVKLRRRVPRWIERRESGADPTSSTAIIAAEPAAPPAKKYPGLRRSTGAP
jgi:hypothetical protein